jgi:hypothetical protein
MFLRVTKKKANVWPDLLCLSIIKMKRYYVPTTQISENKKGKELVKKML